MRHRMTDEPVEEEEMGKLKMTSAETEKKTQTQDDMVWRGIIGSQQS